MKANESSMLPVNIIAGYLVCFMALVWNGLPEMISGSNMLFLLIQGCLLLPISNICLTIGPKFISAPEVSLYMQVITVFAPVLVYLGGFEAPPLLTIVGGAVLLTALTLNNVLALREEATKQVEGGVRYNLVAVDEDVVRV
jgi:drug/metabolite transporter (DMT)-like permease